MDLTPSYARWSSPCATQSVDNLYGMEAGLLCTSVFLGRALGVTAIAGKAQQPEGVHAEPHHIWTTSPMTYQYRSRDACCHPGLRATAARRGAPQS